MHGKLGVLPMISDGEFHEQPHLTVWHNSMSNLVWLLLVGLRFGCPAAYSSCQIYSTISCL